MKPAEGWAGQRITWPTPLAFCLPLTLICHAKTGIRAGVAHLRTDLAMLLRVFGAFFSALATDLSTILTDQTAELTFALHEVDGELAEFGTIDIERDTTLHHLGIAFRFTCFRACFTGE